MSEEGWVDTREGIEAMRWVEHYVEGLVDAIDEGTLGTARRITAPGFIDDGLWGLGMDPSAMHRMRVLAQQAHDCLTARPPDEVGARAAGMKIGGEAKKG